MNIFIVTKEPFPTGLAATNRIRAYAKGFIEHGSRVTILCLGPTEYHHTVFNPHPSGIVDGIRFRYAGGKTRISPYFLGRRIDNAIGTLRACIHVWVKKPQVVIYYSSATTPALLLYGITRLRKILFLKEESELPVVYARTMPRLRKMLFERVHYTLFDGMLLMTRRLINYFTKEKGMDSPYLRVPMTVDCERFTLVKRTPSPPYIAYCGALNNRKDGVDVLIEAFVRIAPRFPDLSLYLIGDSASPEELEGYGQKIRDHGLENRVIFTGRVGNDVIPVLLCNAVALVLARPESIQAEGGFPTKLGEYLATGNPVVVTRVGEIPDYLTDGTNAFVAEPGNASSLAGKLCEVLSDYPRALEVGRKGSRTAFTEFNYKTQAGNVLNFINSFPYVRHHRSDIF